MNVQKLTYSLTPYLPDRVENQGTCVGQLKQACQAVEQNPNGAPSPYEDMSKRDKVQWSRDLGDLGTGAQGAFRTKLGNPAAELRLVQLQGALDQLGVAKRNEVAQAQAEIGELKGAFYGQVAKTAGWMGGTLASMVVTGLLPNPITAVVAVAAGGMCIRSIGKSRTAAKQLGEKVPQLKDQIKAAHQVAGDAAQCAPLLAGWGNLLAQPTRLSA